jgi:hypothetical protein
MENEKYPRRERPGQSHRRGSQQAGRCGRAKGMKGERSFGDLFRPVNIRSKIVSGNPGNPLEIESACCRYASPAIERRMLDPQLTSEGDHTTGLLGPFANDFNHGREGSLNLHFMSSVLVGAFW